MAYCGPRGIALSVFLSWPRTDQDAALMWSAHESKRCRCGYHPDEGDVHAHLEHCPGCMRLAELASSATAKEAVAGTRPVLLNGPAVNCPRCNPNRHE